MSLFFKFKTCAEQELADFLPWVVIIYISGILAFFACNGVGGIFVLGIGGLAGLWMSVFKKRFRVGWIFLSFCLGWGNMAMQTYLRTHNVLTKALYETQIEADVTENRVLMDRQILTLEKIRWVYPDLKMPQKIRVHLKDMDVCPNPGDRVRARVSVYPPNTAFSKAYERQLWFQQIGATGVMHTVTIVKSGLSQTSFLTSLRQEINQHLFDILPQEQAEIAAALMTGEQKLVSRERYQLYRRAGIVHVLSVSGFHMALLAAFLFFIIRHVCALWPRLVLYWNTKKVAAILAFIGTFLYLGISGFQIPAVRAFIMISFVFMGILIERSVFSMRSLWLAGLGILLVSPEKILSISFQLSFMAVMVLIAFCNFLQEKPWSKFLKTGIGFIGLNVLMFVTLIPFIGYHFHHFLPYSIFGNMMFNSLFSFFIMPLLFIGALLMPLGLDTVFFLCAGAGIRVVHGWIKQVAQFPNAEINISDLSGTGLVTIAFGLMLMCFMKTRLKYAGVLLIIAGILSWLFP